MKTKKRVSQILVFALILSTLMSGFAFAAPTVKADEITIKANGHIQSYGDKTTEGKGAVSIGTVGESKRIEALGLELVGAPADMKIRYKAHVQTYGDSKDWIYGPATVGTKGEAKRLEGIQIELVDAKGNKYPGYSVKYRVHMQSFGWGKDNKDCALYGKADSWAVDGEFAGSKGFAKRLEAIEIQILKEDKLAVVSVSANNLKEVEVTFNLPVDKTTAENANAYTLMQGLDNVAIDSATLSENGKTVILDIRAASNIALVNQEEYSLSFTAIKSADRTKEVSLSNKAFKALDVQLPVVEKVEALSNKNIKITFSEPVKVSGTVASAFKIDNRVVSGTSTVQGRDVVLNLFNALTYDAHEITINKAIVDYAGYELPETTMLFTVVEDNVAPIVIDVRNVTFESAIVEFSEEVTPATAETASNYYWMQGSTPRRASSVVKIAPATYKVTFDGAAKLPGYMTDLYIANIKDYAGNTIAANTKFPIRAELDQARPEVITAVFTGNNKVTLTFTKPIDKATFNPNNVKTRKANGDVVVRGYTIGTTPSNVLEVNFSSALGAGEYTFEISGIKDTTILANAMEPYVTQLVVKDENAPVAETVTGTNGIYVMNFSKTMDIDTVNSILNHDNYYVKYTTRAGGATVFAGKLPVGTNLAPANGNKSVIITMPAGFNTLNEITVQGVKDAVGNFLNGFSKTFAIGDINANLTIEAARAISNRKVEVKMNQPIAYPAKDDFVVTGTSRTIVDADVSSSDNTIIVLTLANDDASKLPADVIESGARIKVQTNPSVTLATRSITGSALIANPTGVDISDAIAPSIKLYGDKIGLGTTGSNESITYSSTTATITINFDENIKAKNQANVRDNFLLFRGDGVQLIYGEDYSVSVSINDVSAVTLNLSPGRLTGYIGDINVAFDNKNENIVHMSTDTFVTTTPIEKAANGFDTRTDDKTGSISVDYRTPAAPTAGDITVAQPVAGEAVGQTKITIASTSEFRIVSATNTVKQAWTDGTTGTAITTNAAPVLVAGDKVEVRVKAVGLKAASAVYTHTLVEGEIGLEL